MLAPAAFALVPCAVVVVAVLGFRLTGVQAAGAALLSALLLFAGGVYGTPSGALMAAALADGILLTAVVGATVVPGVLFVEAARRERADAAIVDLVSTIDLPRPQIALLLAFGIGVTIESLTGLGVSLLVTVPLLVRLMPRGTAIALALIGMSLMPYGALSLGPVIGAKLAGIPAGDFAIMLWRISGPVAMVLPLLALLAVGQFSSRDVMWAVIAGVVLWATIGVASVVAGMELAGVAGGLAVLALMIAVAKRSPEFAGRIRAPGLMPYVLLIGCVVAQKMLVPLLVRAGIDPALATDRVRFALLTSPGVSLLTATLLMRRGRIDGALVRATAARCWRAMAATAMFMLTARVLVSAGAIDALAASVANLGPAAALVATALLGAVGGFVTGSGASGNALFLPSAAMTGAFFGARDLFAVVSNSAAGHTAMTSLPVVAILLAAMPDRVRDDERTALRIGLMLAAFHVTVVAAVGLKLM